MSLNRWHFQNWFIWSPNQITKPNRLVPNVQTIAGHAVGTIHLAPATTLHFDTVLKTKYSFPHWNFYFLLK
jgi:hypothetical protein